MSGGTLIKTDIHLVEIWLRKCIFRQSRDIKSQNFPLGANHSLISEQYVRLLTKSLFRPLVGLNTCLAWGSDIIWGGGDTHNPPRDWSFTLTKSTWLIHGCDMHFLLNHQVEILRGSMVFNRSMFYLKQFIIIKKTFFFFYYSWKRPIFLLNNC